MMRFIIAFILSFLSFAVSAQTTQILGAPNTRIATKGDMSVDSILYLPRTLVTSRTPTQAGALRYQASDSALYQWTGTAWRKAGGGDVDTLLLSTRAWRQKGIDSVASVRIGGSGVTGYIPKFTAARTLDSSQIFQSNGLIGIGIGAPTAKLNVVGGGGRLLYVTDSILHQSSANTNITVENHFQNASGVASIDFRTARFGTDGTFGLSRIGGVRSGNGTSDLALSTSASADNPTERMRIFANGRVGVNTTTDAGFQFDVNGTARTGTLTVNTNGQGRTISSNQASGSPGNNTFIGGGGGSITWSSASEGSQNVSVGVNNMTSMTSGFSNNSIGNGSMQAITTANENNSLGFNAMNKLVTGNGNVAFGHVALGGATGVDGSVAIGNRAMGDGVTSGGYNVAIGQSSLRSVTSGAQNTAVGLGTLQNITTSSNNVAFGAEAGRYVNAGTNNITSSNSIYVGQDSRASASGNTNEIVIGYQGRGNGSNTTTIGNSSTTDNYFFGALWTSAPPGGTANAWRLGTVATVTPTSPNRTIEVSIGGTIYYIHAKTTND